MCHSRIHRRNLKKIRFFTILNLSDCEVYMKHCKNCGTFYNSSLPCCPKCNPQLKQYDEEIKTAPKADSQKVKRQWIFLIIGIPALIGMYYLIGLLMRAIGR